VVVDRSCPSCGRHHGRPHLPGTGLDVSISHSGATVAVAVSNAGPVGVDAQLRDLNPDLGYVGALAVLSPGPVVVQERSGERLLTAG
jgi:hypothetical protein